MRTNNVLLIIPAYNEEANIKTVVNDLIQNYPQFDYVVINDGSKDNTLKICRENGFNVIDMPLNVGLAGGVQAGMTYAYQHGYDYAVQFDGDGQHDPKYIEDMVREMDCCDICVASRFATEKNA